MHKHGQVNISLSLVNVDCWLVTEMFKKLLYEGETYLAKFSVDAPGLVIGDIVLNSDKILTLLNLFWWSMIDSC